MTDYIFWLSIWRRTMSNLDDTFEIMNEVFVLTDKIKNSFDIEQNEIDLKRIATLRKVLIDILKEEGIEDEEDNI